MCSIKSSSMRLLVWLNYLSIRRVDRIKSVNTPPLLNLHGCDRQSQCLRGAYANVCLVESDHPCVRVGRTWRPWWLTQSRVAYTPSGACRFSSLCLHSWITASPLATSWTPPSGKHTHADLFVLVLSEYVSSLGFAQFCRTPDVMNTLLCNIKLFLFLHTTPPIFE